MEINHASFHSVAFQPGRHRRRRLIDDLPEKVSIDEYCTLTKEQVALYNEVVKRSMRLVEASKDTFMRHSLVLQMIM